MTDDVALTHISVPETDLVDLRRRLAATRWPPSAADPRQGVSLDAMRQLCARWLDGYDWRATEARLNRFTQVTTVIDGVTVHALHIRSPNPDATPVIMTHGWPGSFLEFEATIPALVEPAEHGGTVTDAVHLVLPSIPGYGFSGIPDGPGWGIGRVADAWVELMDRLGYPRFLAGGSDWGTSISTSVALRRPERLIGLHLVPPLAPPDRDALDLTEFERSALTDLDARGDDGSAYQQVHRTRPQTLGYALDDSPAGLAAWIAEKVWAWADPASSIPIDRLLDNITLYWLTGTATSSTRLYWESIAEVEQWFTTQAPDRITVPTAASVFPAEVPRVSRRWAQRRFPNLVHFGTPARGGHFAAWEQPDLFVDEVRAAVRACRTGRPTTS